MAPAAQPAVTRRSAHKGPGPVGAGPPRAADAQRAGQEGRRRAQRPGPGREHLLQGRLRLDRPGRPARPAALVGPLHPAAARHRRRQDRGPRAARARRRVLHAAGPHRRRPAHDRAAAGGRADLHRSSPGTPPTSPTGRTSSCTGSGSRTCPEIWRRLEAVGLSTTEACGDTPRVDPRLPRRRHRRRRDPRRHAGRRGDPGAVHRVAGVLQPAAQVQDRDQRLAAAGRRARGQRHLLRRRGAPRARPGLRPLGRRRPVDEPDAGPAARRLGAAGRGAVGVGRRRRRVPGLRLPAAAHPGPDQVPRGRLGGRGVPPGPRGGVPRPRARRRARLPRCRTASRDHIGVHRQNDGRYYVGLAPTVGRVSGTTLARLADLAEAHGSQRVRTTPHQKLVVLDVPGRPGRLPGRRRGRAGAAGQAGHLPAQHDGLHRHRVLQAGDRRDQGPRRQADRRARAAAAGLRGAAVDQRQRLPELVRPDPDGRHRAQGPAGARRATATRSRASRSTSAAGSGWTPASAASCAATRSPPTSCPTTSSGSYAGSPTSGAPASGSPSGSARADEEALR